MELIDSNYYSVILLSYMVVVLLACTHAGRSLT